MKSTYHISQYCSIKKGRIILNGDEVFNDDTIDFKDFIKLAYGHFETTYPKFFKMDNLSKLAFLTADLILKTVKTPEQGSNIALVFSNKASSLDTDRMHQKTIADKAQFYPSPAVFVYTLPNICLGEISIRHSLYSENNFFIFDRFNPKHLVDYSAILLDENKAESVLCGWVNYDNNDYESILFLVEKNGKIPFNVEELTHLQQTSWKI